MTTKGNKDPGTQEEHLEAGDPYVGQSLQLLALVVRDHTIHHHPLGTVQDFGVHSETDAFVQQGATCKSRTRLTSLAEALPKASLENTGIPEKALLSHFQREGSPEDRIRRSRS